MRNLLFEFTVKGPPLSVQAKSTSKNRWKAEVKQAAQIQLGANSRITTEEVKFSITYYYKDNCPDVDNIIKPIQDALEGVIYIDDRQIVETKSRRKLLGGSYIVEGASKVLLIAFADGDDFLHITVCVPDNPEVLD